MTTHTKTKPKVSTVTAVAIAVILLGGAALAGMLLSNNSKQLNIIISGTGAVNVSAAGGVGAYSAAGNWSQSYPTGTTVTLSAGGAAFREWSGGICNGRSGNCTITLNEDQTVTALFTPLSNSKQLNISINGTGAVNVSAAGGVGAYSAAGNWSQSYPTGTTVALSAGYNPRSITFIGWSGGGCSGTGNCTVTLNENQLISASFTPSANVTTTTTTIKPITTTTTIKAITTTTTTISGPVSITITAPASGANLTVGQKYAISWTSNKIGDNIKISYSPDSKSWITLGKNLPSAGTFYWKVNVSPKKNARISIGGSGAYGGGSTEQLINIVP